MNGADETVMEEEAKINGTEEVLVDSSSPAAEEEEDDDEEEAWGEPSFGTPYDGAGVRSIRRSGWSWPDPDTLVGGPFCYGDTCYSS